MAIASVATKTEAASTMKGSEHDLWMNEDSVLTVSIGKHCHTFPPNLDQCRHLNDTIQGLARAAKAVIFQAENDHEQNADFAMQPVKDIGTAIILLSQLSEAIRAEWSKTIS